MDHGFINCVSSLYVYAHKKLPFFYPYAAMDFWLQHHASHDGPVITGHQAYEEATLYRPVSRRARAYLNLWEEACLACCYIPMHMRDDNDRKRTNAVARQIRPGISVVVLADATHSRGSEWVLCACHEGCATCVT
jgi:hypothetical protein